MSTTKAQHYVWRNYLKEWADINNTEDGKVFVLRKKIRGSQKTIQKEKLTSVAFEKYYYDISNYTKEDIDLLIEVLNVNREKSILKGIEFSIGNPFQNGEAHTRDFIERSIMCTNEDLDNKWKFREKLLNLDTSFYKDSKQQQALNKLRDDLVLSLLGIKTTKNLSNEEIKQMISELSTTEDTKFDFNQFFWMQFFRSKSIHEKIENNIDEIKTNSEKFRNINKDFFVNILVVYFASIAAISITQNYCSSLIICNNKSTIPFITGDTPIINLQKTESNKGNIFCYPLSPQIMAMLIIFPKTFDMTSKNMNIDISNNQIIDWLNKQMVENCSNELYSNEEEYLETLKPSC